MSFVTLFGTLAGMRNWSMGPLRGTDLQTNCSVTGCSITKLGQLPPRTEADKKPIKEFCSLTIWVWCERLTWGCSCSTWCQSLPSPSRSSSAVHLSHCTSPASFLCCTSCQTGNRHCSESVVKLFQNILVVRNQFSQYNEQ